MSSIEIRIYKNASGKYFGEFVRKQGKYRTSFYSRKDLAIREAKKLHKYLIDRDNSYVVGLQKPKNKTELRRRTVDELKIMMSHNNITYTEGMTKRQIMKAISDVIFKDNVTTS